MNQFVVVDFSESARKLLFLEPIIEALYYKHAPCKIILHVNRPNLPVLAGHPLIHAIVEEDGKFKYGILDKDTPRKWNLTGHGKLHFWDWIKDGDTVYGYDFNNLHEFQNLHLLDSFTEYADVQLLRRTPSFGRYAHVPDAQDVVVQLRDGIDTWENFSQGFPPELRDTIPCVIQSDGASRNRETIGKSTLFIGEADSDGLITAHAAGVRNIVGFYHGHENIKRWSLPGVQYFNYDQLDAAGSVIKKMLISKKYPDALNVGNAADWIKGKALQHCKGRGLDVGSNQWPLLDTIPSDEASRKFDQGPFDYIFSSHCLEHIRDWQAELKLWSDSIKPGGTLFLYLPHPAMEFWRPGGAWVGAHHVWGPSPVTLVQWINENTDLRVQEYSAYPDFLWSFYVVAKREA